MLFKMKHKAIGEDYSENWCFICKDGGKLVMCERENCPKSYHAKCLRKSIKESAHYIGAQMKCPWHFCSVCKEDSLLLRCCTCPYSVCQSCRHQTGYADFLQVKKSKGFCRHCLKVVLMIEEEKGYDSEGRSVDFDNFDTEEGLFKDYYMNIKTIKLEEIRAAEIRSKNNKDFKSRSSSRSSHDEEEGESKDDLNYMSRLEKNSDDRQEKAQKNLQAKFVPSEELKNKLKMSMEVHEDQTREEFKMSRTEKNDEHVKKISGSDALKNEKKRQRLQGEEFNEAEKRQTRKDKSKSKRENNGEHGKSKISDCDGKENENKRQRLQKEEIFERQELYVQNDSKTERVGLKLENDSEKHRVPSLVSCGKEETPDMVKKCAIEYRTSGSGSHNVFAAVVLENLKLVYLKKSLLCKLLEEPESFEEKVTGCFVRVISNPRDKKSTCYLMRVKGVKPVSFGENNENTVLQFSALPEESKISLISDGDILENECENLRQKVRDGLFERPTVAEFEQKAKDLHKDITKHWIDNQVAGLTRQFDKANEKGWYTKFEYLAEIKKLKSPWEQSRLLNAVPIVIPDPDFNTKVKCDEMPPATLPTSTLPSRAKRQSAIRRLRSTDQPSQLDPVGENEEAPLAVDPTGLHIVPVEYEPPLQSKIKIVCGLPALQNVQEEQRLKKNKRHVEQNEVEGELSCMNDDIRPMEEERMNKRKKPVVQDQVEGQVSYVNDDTRLMEIRVAYNNMRAMISNEFEKFENKFKLAELSLAQNGIKESETDPDMSFINLSGENTYLRSKLKEEVEKREGLEAELNTEKLKRETLEAEFNVEKLKREALEVELKLIKERLLNKSIGNNDHDDTAGQVAGGAQYPIDFAGDSRVVD